MCTESFADRDALVAAVYDDVVATIAERTLESVRAAEGAEAKVRAGLDTLVRRVASTRMFVRLLVGQTREFYNLATPDATGPVADAGATDARPSTSPPNCSSAAWPRCCRRGSRAHWR